MFKNKTPDPAFDNYNHALHLLRRAHAIGLEGHIQTVTNNMTTQKLYIVTFLWPNDWKFHDVHCFVNDMMKGFEEW